MHACVLLQTVPAAVETIAASLADQPGFLGLEEVPAPDAAGYPVDPTFRVLEYGSDAARQYTAWIARDGYRRGDQVWLRVYLEVADELALTNWLAAWQGLPCRVVNTSLIAPQDYVALSQIQHSGQSIGQQLWVGPPWESPPPGRLPVVIEPGMAFGTGDHPTTRLCLELLEQVVAELPAQPLRVLDVGTGSGILAIAAAKLCPDCELWTTDLDPQCAANAARNFELNGLAGPPQQAFWGPAADLAHLPAPAGAFDLVLSNIYATALGDLVDPVAAFLRPGGHWIVSGLLAGEQEPVFREAWTGRFERAHRRALTQSYAELSPATGLAPAAWEWVALQLHRTA